jgi:hypothetical protein
MTSNLQRLESAIELWQQLERSTWGFNARKIDLSSTDPELLAEAIEWGLLRATPDYFGWNGCEQDQVNDFLSSHPHTLMGSDFDEARVFSKDKAALVPPELDHFLRQYFSHRPPFALKNHEVLLRERASGMWYLFHISKVDKFPRPGELFLEFLGADGRIKSVPRDQFTTELVGNLRKHISLGHTSTVFNTLWTPPSVDKSSIHAFTFADEIFRQVRDNKLRLADITWRQLEELVAEVLARRGFEIKLTKKTRDGGRDVIAIGEFFPGARIEMAVEVTKRKTVGMEKVSKALYQNRHFPKIMIATSGAFSSEVLREQQLPENRYRLILKDGVSMLDWIVNGL